MSRPRASVGDAMMGHSQSDNETEGWLFRVTDPNVPSPRYFVVGLLAVEEARQLLQDQPDIAGDKIEAVGPVSASNMLEFEVGVGEVTQIDAPYP